MSTQKFYANPNDTYSFSNGAIGYRSGGSFDCLGPYAKVKNCPVTGTSLRLTCYATSYADTFFSVPACTRYKGKYISGFFMMDGDDVSFNVNQSHQDRIPELVQGYQGHVSI